MIACAGRGSEYKAGQERAGLADVRRNIRGRERTSGCSAPENDLSLPTRFLLLLSRWLLLPHSNVHLTDEALSLSLGLSPPSPLPILSLYSLLPRLLLSPIGPLPFLFRFHALHATPRRRATMEQPSRPHCRRLGQKKKNHPVYSSFCGM